MFKSKFISLGFAVSLSMAHVTSFAVPGVGSVMGTGGASEITQLLNNVQLGVGVGEQVKTVSQLVQTYQTTYSQLQQQLLAGMNIQGFTLGNVTTAKNALDNYQGSLRSYQHDAGSLGTVFDTRLTEAKLQNITFEEYVRREGVRVEAGNQAAKARLQREVDLLGQIQEDAAQIKRYGDQIPDTVGVHEATRLLNAQTNLLLQQMSRLTAIMLDSQGSGSKNAIQQNNATVDNALSEGIAGQIDAKQSVQKAAERAAILRMRP